MKAMFLTICVIMLAAIFSQPSQPQNQEKAEEREINPSLSAQEIANKFVSYLRETSRLDVDSEQELRATVRNKTGEVILERDITLTVTSTMRPDRSEAVFSVRSTKGEVTGIGTFINVGKKLPSSLPESMEGALTRRIGVSTCAGGEFIGTWIGEDSPMGSGWLIEGEATLSIINPNTSDESEYQYQVKEELYSFEDEEGDFVERKHVFWYDRNFRMVKRKVELLHINSDGVSSEHTVTATYSYTSGTEPRVTRK